MLQVTHGGTKDAHNQHVYWTEGPKIEAVPTRAGWHRDFRAIIIVLLSFVLFCFLLTFVSTEKQPELIFYVRKFGGTVTPRITCSIEILQPRLPPSLRLLST
jgi:hypothetical protein